MSCYVYNFTGSRVALLKTPIPASYIAVEEAVSVIRERCYRDDQTPVLKSEQFRYVCDKLVSCSVHEAFEMHLQQTRDT